ncbi:MAG: fibronectin type III domain-containing protein [Syntrophothermus sp.]
MTTVSEKIARETPSDTTAPDAISDLAEVSKTATTITMDWTAATGATGYKVYRGASMVENTTSTTYTDTGLTTATEYSYTVKSYDAAGNKSAASNTLTVTTS